MRKLEDNYFKDWLAGTELGREGFKQIMREELRRCVCVRACVCVCVMREELRRFEKIGVSLQSSTRSKAVSQPTRFSEAESSPTGF